MCALGITSDSQRQRARNIAESQCCASPTAEDLARYDELEAREFAVCLPPVHTVLPLLQAIPGLAGAKHGAAC
jgi:hypothetical protein